MVLGFASLVLAQTPEKSPTVVTTTNAVERAQTEVENTKANSTVRGRAVFDDTDRPIRRASVSLLSTNGSSQSVAKTNASGEFEITNVRAGSYFVMVDVIGVLTPISFVNLQETNRERYNFDEIRKYFTEVVVDGENSVSIKVRARRGGAISGKVTYSDGDPAIGVRLIITRNIDGKMARFITNLDPAMLFGIRTDDRGMFRIAGLPPGEYKLAAAESVDHGDGKATPEYLPFPSLTETSLLVTYYPGTTKLEDAAVLQVNAGQEHNEINISLAERALGKISGTVVAKRDRKPLAPARLNLRPKDDKAPASPLGESGTTINSDENGQFEFKEIPDGVYTLSVNWNSVPSRNEDIEDEEGQPTPPSPRGEEPRALSRRQQDVTVHGSDVADLTVMLSDGASVSGTITMDSQKPAPTALSVNLVGIDGENLTEIPDQVGPDGSFSIEGLAPAAAFALVGLQAMEEPYFIKALTTSSGKDLTREPLVITEGADISGLRIVLSADGGTISGRTISSQNSPVGGAGFVLVPVDPTLWRTPVMQLFIEADGTGNFEISGAPGEYLAIFVAPDNPARLFNDAWIRERASGAQRVNLIAKQSKKVDLIVPAH
jgi:hypothetical protein